MKNLYNGFRSESNARFVWQATPPAKAAGTAESVTTALTALETKKDTSKNLQDLIDENGEFKNALDKARDELTAYRIALLGGKPKPASVSESFVENIIKNTAQSGEINQLKGQLGIDRNASSERDADDDFDLDEFAATNDVVSEYFIEIIARLNNVTIPTQQTEILKKTLTRASIDGLTALQADPSEQSQANFIDYIAKELEKDGFDIGILMKEVATQAKLNKNNKSVDVDVAIKKFLDEVKIGKPVVDKAAEKPIASGMEKIATSNPELQGFLAEFYPTASGNSLEDDINTYNTKNPDKKITETNYASTLPEFFLYNTVNENGKSISENLRNQKGEDAFIKLKEKITADLDNDAPAQSIGGGVMNSLTDLWTDVKSNMPPSFQHLKFDDTKEYFTNAENVEDLFTAKMSDLLNNENINFKGVTELGRPLKMGAGSLDNEMIDRLFKSIPVEYDGKTIFGNDYGKNYREAVTNGLTRKTWNEWFKDNSGATVMERGINKVTNLLSMLAELCQKFNIFPEWSSKYLENQKKEDGAESAIQTELEGHLSATKTVEQENDKKQLWVDELTKDNANFVAFREFHKNNKDVLNVKPLDADLDKWLGDNNHKAGDLPEAFGKTTPDEFKKMNTAKTRDILVWARASTHPTKINDINWKFIVDHQDPINIVAKTDKNGNKILDKDGKEISILSLTPNDASLDKKSIERWSDEGIEKLSTPNRRHERFNEFLDQEKGIFDDSVTYGSFNSHKNELFENPEDGDNVNFKAPFAELFTLDKKFWQHEGSPYKMSNDDLNSLINNIDKIKGDVKQTDTTDDKYWTMYNGKAERVEDGKLVSDNSTKIKDGADVPTFEVNIKGESTGGIIDWDTNQDFDSMKSLIERLKISYKN